MRGRGTGSGELRASNRPPVCGVKSYEEQADTNSIATIAPICGIFVKYLCIHSIINRSLFIRCTENNGLFNYAINCTHIRLQNLRYCDRPISLLVIL